MGIKTQEKIKFTTIPAHKNRLRLTIRLLYCTTTKPILASKFVLRIDFLQKNNTCLLVRYQIKKIDINLSIIDSESNTKSDAPLTKD